MATPIPNASANPDDLALPPVRDIIVQATDGTGPTHYFPTVLVELDVHIDYASGRPLGIGQDTCDHTTGISINIMQGTNFIPVMIGWKKHVKVGFTTTVTDESTQLNPDCSALTYPWVDTSGDATWRDSFKVWRLTPP